MVRRIVLAVVLAGVSAFFTGGTSWGQPGDARPYIVFSANADLRAEFGVRHEFRNQFTATLGSGQLRALARRGIRTEPVRLYHPIAKEKPCSPWPSCRDGGGSDPAPAPTDRLVWPSDATPWGIETIYGDAAILTTSGGAGINVAVLDTGVTKDHLDLSRRVAQCVNFTGGPPGALRINEGECADKDGHGTHVAGTILADGGADGEGIYGVAPGAMLLAYKVCGGGGCWGDDIAAAIDYAGASGAHIVSMSLGGDSESSLIKEAIARNPDLLIVAAAGNDGPAIGSIDYPGANANVVAVAALGIVGTALYVPDWSSRGVNQLGDEDLVIDEREVELAAPGVSVESTYRDGGYAFMSGTSMATPHISGLAAKLWQGSAAATRSYLDSLADTAPMGLPHNDPSVGFGIPTVPLPSGVN